MINKKMPTAVAGSIVFVLLTILFLTLGGLTQFLNVYFGIFFTEAIILGLTTVLICKYKKYDLRETLGLNLPFRGTLWKAFFIAILSYPLMVSLNGIYLSFVEKFIKIPSDIGVPLPDSFGKLIISIFMFAVLPGIFEELVFRGFLFRAFDRFKPAKQIIITAVLFAIFHYNPVNVVGPFLMGLTFGYMRHRSNSLLPSMIAHTTNNSIAMIIGFVANNTAGVDMDADPDMAQIEAMLGDAKIMIIVMTIALFALIVFCLYKLLRKYPDYSERISKIIEPDKNEKTALLLMMLFAIILFAITFVLFSHKF